MKSAKLCLLFAFFLLAPAAIFGQEDGTESKSEKRIESTIKTEDNGDIFLIQEMTIKAPVEEVWNTFSTSEGWASWSTPAASVDMKIGGLIKSNYRKDGKLTDADTITMHIINYVPQRAITLQTWESIKVSSTLN